MSFKLMAQALDIITGSSTTKLVLLKLCDNANDEGVCWPSQQTIADQCEMSRMTVSRHIKILIEKGLIASRNRCVTTGKTSNVYQINLDVTNSYKDGNTELQTPVTESYINLPVEPTIEPTKKIIELLPFDVFWSDYPRKIGKGAARAAYSKAIKKASVDTILGGLLKHEIQTMKDAQFIPHPATWLNQERWDDEVVKTTDKPFWGKK